MNKQLITAFLLSCLAYLQAGIGFLSTIFLARVTDKEVFGLINYGIAIGSILSVIVDFGSQKTLIRDLLQNENKLEIISSSIILRCSIAVLMIIIFLSWLIFQDLKFPYKITLMIIALWGILESLNAAGWFDSQYKMVFYSKISCIERFIYSIMIIALYFLVENPYYCIAIGFSMLFSRTISLFCQWKLFFKDNLIIIKGVWNCIRFTVKGSVLFFAAMLANRIISHANQIVLGNRVGLADLSTYTIAFQITTIVQIVQYQLIRTYSPGISRDIGLLNKLSRKEIKNSLYKKMLISGMATMVLIVPILILSESLIGILYGKTYLNSSVVLKILCLWLSIYGPGLIVNQFLVSLNMSSIYFSITIFSGLLSLVLGFYLIEYYKEIGVAIALFVSHSISIVGQFYFVILRINKI